MYLQIRVNVTKPIHPSFCQNIAHSSLGPLAPRIAKDLGPFLLVTSEDTLTLVLEALSVVVEIEGDWMTAQCCFEAVEAVVPPDDVSPLDGQVGLGHEVCRPQVRSSVRCL